MSLIKEINGKTAINIPANSDIYNVHGSPVAIMREEENCAKIASDEK